MKKKIKLKKNFSFTRFMSTNTSFESDNSSSVSKYCENTSKDEININLFEISETETDTSDTEKMTEELVNEKLRLELEGLQLDNEKAKLEIEHLRTTIEMNKIFSSFKTPDIIKELPDFNGELEYLHQFIQNVDEIIKLCKEALPKDEEIPLTFIKAIKNKIKGNANKVLASIDYTNNWNIIKQTLIDHYADKRTEVALIRDLHRTRQGLLTSKQFYDKILEIQIALTARAKLEHCNNGIKEELFKQMCLSQYIANLREPLGSNIRARDPEDLNTALEFCVTEENMYYIKYKPTIRTQNNWQQKTPPNWRNPTPNNFVPSNLIKVNNPEKTFRQFTPKTEKTNTPNIQKHMKFNNEKQYKYKPIIKQEKLLYNTEAEEDENYEEPEELEEAPENEDENENVNEEFFLEEASE